MESQKLDDIKLKFHNEWLLVSIDEVDPSTGCPSRGKLINHSKSADELWKEAENHTEPVMILYSDDWPEDLAACFVISLK